MPLLLPQSPFDNKDTQMEIVMDKKRDETQIQLFWTKIRTDWAE